MRDHPLQYGQLLVSASRLDPQTYFALLRPWAIAGVGGLLSALLVFAPAVEAREPTATEQFAFNVFLKRLTFGDNPKTSYLEGSWKARCKHVKARRPTATCAVHVEGEGIHRVDRTDAHG